MRKQIYSKAEDCQKLAKLINNNKKLRRNIYYTTARYLEVVEGLYASLPMENYVSYEAYYNDKLPFSYLYNKQEFLKLTICNYTKSQSMGHKLAALSDFYEELNKYFGKPSIFYTIKEDYSESINIEWIFNKKEEVINEFINGKPFDDANIDNLIIFKNKSNEIRDAVENLIGLPCELVDLVEDNIKDFIYYKTGKKEKLPETNIITNKKEKTILTRKFSKK